MWIAINDRYSISTEGEVMNTKTSRILKPWGYGAYLGVWLGAGNKHYIHHLVGKFLLPQPTSEGCVLDHINRNKHDNSASNLRWVDESTNQRNKNIEMKSRKQSKTGEHHISIDSDGRFIFTISYGDVKIRQRFKTIEEAIKYRDDVIINAV